MFVGVFGGGWDGGGCKWIVVVYKVVVGGGGLVCLLSEFGFFSCNGGGGIGKYGIDCVGVEIRLMFCSGVCVGYWVVSWVYIEFVYSIV